MTTDQIPATTMEDLKNRSDRIAEARRFLDSQLDGWDDMIRDLHQQGETLRALAAITGLSHQRIHQIVS
jgi:DNA-directed RNA polymerase sigma subunit (sigma70/sigma32)